MCVCVCVCVSFFFFFFCRAAGVGYGGKGEGGIIRNMHCSFVSELNGVQRECGISFIQKINCSALVCS